jgi:hypothetical protein
LLWLFLEMGGVSRAICLGASQVAGITDVSYRCLTPHGHLSVELLSSEAVTTSLYV